VNNAYIQTTGLNTLQLDLHIKIYRNQVYVGHFEYKNVTFVLPPGGVDLNGKIA
jgi:hypothetical protein